MMTAAQELEFDYVTACAVDELLGRPWLIRKWRVVVAWTKLVLFKRALPAPPSDLVPFRVRPWKYASSSDVMFMGVKMANAKARSDFIGQHAVETEMRP